MLWTKCCFIIEWLFCAKPGILTLTTKMQWGKQTFQFPSRVQQVPQPRKRQLHSGWPILHFQVVYTIQIPNRDGYLPMLDGLKVDEPECEVTLALFACWANDGCVIAVSANGWMLALSILNIVLTLLSNFSSFSTFWEHALHTLLEGRHSLLLLCCI